MTKHFIWFIARSAVNRTRRRLRQLRSPRYAIAMVFGLAYFWFIFGGWFDGRYGGEPFSDGPIRAARTAGPFFVALFAAWWWLWGGHRRAILFTPAETHLLLPAPVSRRALIRFKLMQAQLPILLSATIFSLFTRGSPLPWPLRLLSLWAMFATLHLHQIAASLVHAAAEQHGTRGLRRVWLPAALFATAFTVLLATLARAVPAARDAGSLAGAAAALGAALEQPAASVVLAPFRALLAPTIAASFDAWLPAAGLLAVLLVAHYVWVQRSNAAFEETAVAEGEKQAQQIEVVRAGGLSRLHFSAAARKRGAVARPWLTLRPTGLPAFALFWKNMLYMQRLLRPSSLITLLAVFGPVAAIGWIGAGSAQAALRTVATLLLAVAGLVTLAGALMFRNDLRLDLKHIDQLRTYPLRGRDLVGAGVAASAACMSIAQFALLAGGGAIAIVSGMVTPLIAAGIAIVALIALPVLNALAALIQNALALLFPAWSRIGEPGAGGMEAMGQNMVNLIGTVVLLALAAIPPILLGIVVGAPLALQLGELAIIPAAAAALAGVAGEVVVLVLWLGRLLDTLDPVEAELLR